MPDNVVLAAAAGFGVGFGLAAGVVVMRAFIRWSERNGK